MQIGIVSKDSHSKSHARALEDDGYGVLQLGGSPTTIPDNVDVVVLRTQSCSHGASNTAFEWARNGGRPLIVENGISGIRRELKALVDDRTLFDKERFTRALALLKKDRPKDNPEQWGEALRALGAPAQLVEVLLGTERPSPQDRWATGFPGPYPKHQKWTKACPEDRLRRELTATKELFNQTSKEVLEEVARMYQRLRSGGRFAAEGAVASRQGWEPFYKTQGRPTRFFLFVLKALDPQVPLVRKDLAAAYDHFTGKGTDTRVAEGAAWILGREIQEGLPTPEPVQEPQVETRNSSEEPTTFQGPPEVSELVVGKPLRLEHLPGVEQLRSEFEEHVLELMGQVSSLVRENQEIKTTLTLLQKQQSTLKDEFKLEAAPLDQTQVEKGLGELQQKHESYADSVRDLVKTVSDLAHKVEQLGIDSRLAEAPDLTATIEAAVDARISKMEKTRNVDVLAAIDELRERGAKVSITFDPVEL